MPRDNSYLIGNKQAAGNPPNKTSFKKGLVPWNKGKKGIHLSPTSEWKPGRQSEHAVPEGTITARRTKGGKHRQFIKTPVGWFAYAQWLWEQEFGPLIAGDVVHHINGDCMDDRLDNLLALPRIDHPRYHGAHDTTPLVHWELHHHTAEGTTHILRSITPWPRKMAKELISRVGMGCYFANHNSPRCPTTHEIERYKRRYRDHCPRAS